MPKQMKISNQTTCCDVNICQKYLCLMLLCFFLSFSKFGHYLNFPPSQLCIGIASTCLALPCIALACHRQKLRFPGHLFCLGARERKREEGETFVCKTCRGRSIHPFQKNNITFKWRNSLEPPNPIFEPRSLSRTFPFWIFHSPGPHLIGDYPPSIRSGRCKNYPDHISFAQVRKLS